jgi:hypothetical protein
MVSKWNKEQRLNFVCLVGKYSQRDSRGVPSAVELCVGLPKRNKLGRNNFDASGSDGDKWKVLVDMVLNLRIP